jgi:hypothetical protein
MKHPFPTFLIIGAQKSATRWLRVNLGKHPDVFTAVRELEFFNHHFDRGALWYLEQFDGYAGQAQVGEATPGYMMWNEQPHVTAARIDGMLPGVKLLAVLRNPIDRAQSAFIHHKKYDRLPEDTALVDFVETVDPREDHMSIISGGWYAESLERYRARFGERLKVLLNEDVATRPEEVYESALTFIGADSSFRPEGLGGVLFSNRNAESVRTHGGLPQEDRQRLKKFFEEDVDRLRMMFDVDLRAWSEFSEEHR